MSERCAMSERTQRKFLLYLIARSRRLFIDADNASKVDCANPTRNSKCKSLLFCCSNTMFRIMKINETIFLIAIIERDRIKVSRNKYLYK